MKELLSHAKSVLFAMLIAFSAFLSGVCWVDRQMIIQLQKDKEEQYKAQLELMDNIVQKSYYFKSKQ